MSQAVESFINSQVNEQRISDGVSKRELVILKCAFKPVISFLVIASQSVALR